MNKVLITQAVKNVPHCSNAMTIIQIKLNGPNQAEAKLCQARGQLELIHFVCFNMFGLVGLV